MWHLEGVFGSDDELDTTEKYFCSPPTATAPLPPPRTRSFSETSAQVDRAFYTSTLATNLSPPFNPFAMRRTSLPAPILYNRSVSDQPETVGWLERRPQEGLKSIPCRKQGNSGWSLDSGYHGGYASAPVACEAFASLNHSPPQMSDAVFETETPKPKSPRHNTSWTAPPYPLRGSRNSLFHAELSSQVFLGGIPFDIEEADIQRAFLPYGKVEVKWPPTNGDSIRRPGFVYIIFEQATLVKNLLLKAEVRNDQFFLPASTKLKSSKKSLKKLSRPKDVEVIPWFVKDTRYTRTKQSPEYDNYHREEVDSSREIFIGGLHGMMTAKLIAKMLEDLFGAVKSVSIDTDLNKYPTGSGRAVFASDDGFKEAMKVKFVDVKHSKFVKRVQIEPFIQDNKMCQRKCGNFGTRFCRDQECLMYYCLSCWKKVHKMYETEHDYGIKQKASTSS